MENLDLWMRLSIIAIGSFAFEWAWVAYIYAIHANRKFLATFWCASIATLSMTVYNVIFRNDDSILSIATYVVFHAAATLIQMHWKEMRKK
jgi:lipid-A-disaccharide synthase-like uncharacterized protein